MALEMDDVSHTILVADDEEEYRAIFSKLLKPVASKLLLVEDGEQALEKARSELPDLILLDVNMPRRTGFSACRALKSDPKTRLIPVIIVTAMNNREDRIQGIECGADDFINKPFDKEELLARTQSLLKLKHFTDELESAERVVFTLALSVEAKDPYTEGHCDRLSKYSVAIGEHLNLSPSQLTALRRGGVLHDLGKIAIPEHILLKPGPLTPEERRIIEDHTVIGERICQPLKSLRLVLPIIRHHHEKLDGTGYPDKLKGDAIPLLARILTTVDVYDALTTDRPYRKALHPDEAFKLIREEVARGWWDGSLVDVFETIIRSSKQLSPR